MQRDSVVQLPFSSCPLTRATSTQLLIMLLPLLLLVLAAVVQLGPLAIFTNPITP